jgi:murein DD-endopeptidase MepM/ murein hydrolase activator NlpD
MAVWETGAVALRLNDRPVLGYTLSEYHEARTRAPLARVIEAAREVSLADMPGARFLLHLRYAFASDGAFGTAGSTPLLDFMTRPGTGFLALDRSDPQELVYGIAGKPWAGAPPPPVHTPAEFRAFSAPGTSAWRSTSASPTRAAASCASPPRPASSATTPARGRRSRGIGASSIRAAPSSAARGWTRSSRERNARDDGRRCFGARRSPRGPELLQRRSRSERSIGRLTLTSFDRAEDGRHGRGLQLADEVVEGRRRTLASWALASGVLLLSSSCSTLPRNDGPAAYPEALTSEYCLPFDSSVPRRVIQGNSEDHKFPWTHHGNMRFAYDFAMPIGTQVRASRGGMVMFIRDQYSDDDHQNSHGNVMVVLHEDGTAALYGHLMLSCSTALS